LATSNWLPFDASPEFAAQSLESFPDAAARARAVDPAHNVVLEASAGTASFPTDGQRAEEVLLAADRALFVAKRSGGGRVASAAEGLALTGEFSLQTPTPIDPLATPA